MKKQILIIILLSVALGTGSEIRDQRKAVSGAEVTGTFRSYFKGVGRGSYNEILIQALGGNKLKIEMSLVYPYKVNREAPRPHFTYESDTSASSEQ